MTKTEAFKLLMRVKKTGNALTPTELDGLLAYFAPPKSKVSKEPLAWAAKAVNPKDPREALRYVMVKNSTAYGTDGLRIHKATVDLADGFYDPKSLLKIEVTPSMKGSIIPAERLEGFFEINVPSAVIEEHTLGDLTEVVAEVDGKPVSTAVVWNNTKSVNYNHLSEALNHDKTTPFKSFWDNSVRGVKVNGTTEFGQFILMGLR